MLKSVKEIAAWLSLARETVQRRADDLGLIHVTGDKSAKLYETKEIAALKPLPTRSGDGESTLEEARIRQTLADAKEKELTALKLESVLADVSEVMAAQNDLFDSIAVLIKRSSMTPQEKEEILESISNIAREWES